MKRLLLFISILSSGICFGQKTKAYFIDKTDPFTKERTIYYGNTYINEFAQAGVELKIMDTSKTYGISFLVPYQNVAIEGEDSTIKECKLKTSDGQIINGKWINTTHATVLGQAYSGFNYQFSENDFHTLQATAITAVKMNQYTYELPAKNQKKIGELIKVVYSKL